MTGDHVLEGQAYSYLYSMGYRLQAAFKFSLPRPDHTISIMELQALRLLHRIGYGDIHGILCDSHTDVAGEKEMNKEPELSLEQAKNLAAEGKFPKVTEVSIKDKIAVASYLSHTASSGGVLTICILEMSNGFMVHGVSAAADPRNHNEEIGKRYAFENAFKQLWQLEGYLLRQNLFHQDENQKRRDVTGDKT